MKLTKLLVLSALMLFGVGSVNAADLIERAKPSPVIDAEALAAIEKVAAEFEVGKYYVLYNKGAQQYFSQGNNWGTRASVSDLPILVKFSIPEGKTLEDNALLLEDYCIYSKGWKRAFFDSETAIFVDRRDQANFYWQVVPQGNKVYRLQASEANPSLNPSVKAGYVGRDPEVAADNGNNEGSRNVNLENTFPISPFMESGWIDWEFYEVKAWNLYEPAAALKDAIEKAEAAGIDITAAVTVYNNEASTAEQMKAAAEALNATMTDNIANASGQYPQDASSWIVNGSFDVQEDFTGWEGSSFGAGGTMSTNAERYNMTFDTYQDITIKYPGLYLFGVNAFYRAGSADNAYKLYTENDPDATLARLYVTAEGITNELTLSSIFEGVPTTKPAHGKAMSSNGYWIPNTMDDANAFFHEDHLYGHILPVEISGSNVTVRLGVKKDKKISDNDWSIFDDFTLYFCGAGEDRYIGYAKMASATYPLYENVVATQAILDAYNNLKSNPTGNDRASVDAYLADLKAARKALDENMALWSQWEDAVKEGQEMLIDDNYLQYDEIDPLLDYCDAETPTATYLAIKAARSLNNEELTAEIAKLKEMMDAVKDAVKNAIQAGDDVTYMLTNPSFDLRIEGTDGKLTGKPEEGWTGWHKTTNSMPTTGGLTDANKEDYNITAEAWSAKEFDLYQEVEKAPAGVYEIEVQGFFRYGRDDAAYTNYQNKDEEYVKPGGAPVFVYMNDVKTPFMNVYDVPSLGADFYASMAETDAETGEPAKTEGGLYKWRDIPYSVQNYPATDPTEFYPNGMTSAALAFSGGYYKQSAKSLIAKKGDKLRIGVKGSTQLASQSDCWVIWDNFKLTYKGFEAESVKPVLKDAIDAAKANLEKSFGSDLRATLVEKLEAAEGLLNSEDGKAMFDAAAALVAVDVDGSIALFAELAADINSLQVMAGNQMGITDDANVTEAYELAEEASLKMEGNTLSDVEAKEYKDKIAEVMAKLKMPAGMENASDDNDVNVTAFITNPKYTDNKDDGWTGGAAVNYHEAEMFNKTFDYYQDLEGLLPGTYKVTVQGFYRAGGHGPAKDYASLNEDPTTNNLASLYAKVGDNTFASPLKRLSTELVELVAGEEVPGGWGAAKTDTITWQPDTVVQHFVVPNNMEQAEVAFQKTDDAFNYSGNQVIFKVGDDGKARIGIKKSETLENDWTIWTNWTLTYYGKNSALEPSAIGRIAGESRVVKTEYYSLSGSRLKSARGLVIVKQTMSDGRVRVIKKVK